MTAAGPDVHVTRPQDRDSAMRTFTGVLDSAEGVYHPMSRNRIRVLELDEWLRIEAEALGLAETDIAADDPAQLAEQFIRAGAEVRLVPRVLRRLGIPNPIAVTIDAARRVEQGATS
jgi:hypothetical protein